MKMRRWFAIAVVASLFVVAACGGSDGGGDTPADGDVPDDGAGPGGFERFAPFAGAWAGVWNNDTFGTTARMTIAIAINADGTASFTIDLPASDTGAPFGIPAIGEPKTLTGTFDDGGLIVVMIGDDLFGDMTVRITPDGVLTAQASMEPLLAISELVVEGTITGNTMDFTYEVTSSDGSGATGTATLTKL